MTDFKFLIQCQSHNPRDCGNVTTVNLESRIAQFVLLVVQDMPVFNISFSIHQVALPY